ncbi:MAG: mu-protocadherin-cell-suface protein, partial [Verrucomicrobia bacterium]|nr:mu-protocadherin-cell-suface protein [Verrucomicrobiota bacterium]
KKTQRVAWKIGSNSSTVIEAGLKNLTEDVASCLVHFGTDTTQTWLLVRLKDPDMPRDKAVSGKQ